MKVEVVYQNDRERNISDPVLEPGGRKFVLRVYDGDICYPLFGTLFGEKWFEPPYPKHVVRGNGKRVFVCFKWPFMERCCYFGWKLFGVDSEAYKNWLPPEEVYEGSQALCLTIRPFARLG